MKKTIFIITVLLCVAPFLQSCTNSCTCINPDTNAVTDIDIGSSEKCSDYSNATRGNCS